MAVTSEQEERQQRAGQRGGLLWGLGACAVNRPFFPCPWFLNQSKYNVFKEKTITNNYVNTGVGGDTLVRDFRVAW